jgi:DNA-binding MarR family transcriptional regulator
LHIQISCPMKTPMVRSHSQSVVDRIAGECLMGRWRMVNRLLAGIYDEEMRPFGLKSSQLNLLVGIAKAGPVRRIDLGKRLHLDPSTLTRNLQIMLKQGWIDEVADDRDQRGGLLNITTSGRKLLNRVEPAWNRAQARAKRMLGADGAAFVLALKRGERSA